MWLAILVVAAVGINLATAGWLGALAILYFFMPETRNTELAGD